MRKKLDGCSMLNKTFVRAFAFWHQISIPTKNYRTPQNNLPREIFGGGESDIGI
jgi:hypothetical protein